MAHTHETHLTSFLLTTTPVDAPCLVPWSSILYTHLLRRVRPSTVGPGDPLATLGEGPRPGHHNWFGLSLFGGILYAYSFNFDLVK